MHEISFIRPDDFHCHLRDNDFLSRTVPDVAIQFARAIVMPNLSPPLTSISQAAEYLKRITENIPKNMHFTPLMTLFLTETLAPNDIQQAKESGFIHAVKLYPAHVTTHAQYGVKNMKSIYPLLEAMQHHDLPLLIHGELIEPEVDIFDREARFIERHLIDIIKTFPRLRIVLEHVSTKFGVDFITHTSGPVAATITPHHLWLNRNSLLSGGLKPHHYCLPILKTKEDQAALIAAATSGNPKFFLGTDSAPHAKSQKESGCCPAGIYNGHSAIELYAEIFDRENALDKLEGFASRFGADFYHLPLNKEPVTLQNKSWKIPETLPFGKETIVPFLAGQTLSWRLK